MTEKVTWICDGCDEKLERRPNTTSDWKLYSATLDNAAGYPLCRSSGTIHINVHLCPNCARHYADILNPHNWPRAAKPAVNAA